jgi:crotonobetainyl-CoA:carnitine CoA-transferase CaiB-like acyl-CoA transferase
VLGEHVARVAAGHPPGWGQAFNRRSYRAADGRLVTIAAAEPRTWAAFCEAVERPDLAGGIGTPPDQQDAMADDLTKLFATRTAAEWEATLADSGAAVGPVRAVADLFDDEHVKARGAVVELDDDAHTRVLRTPVRLRDAQGNETPVHLGPAPALGEHTDVALAEAGFEPNEIADFHARGVV